MITCSSLTRSATTLDAGLLALALDRRADRAHPVADQEQGAVDAPRDLDRVDRRRAAPARSRAARR